MKKIVCLLLLVLLSSNFALSVYADESDYRNGYENGYSEGFKAGKEEGIQQEKNRYEEMIDNQKGAMFTVAVAVGIPVVLGYIDKKKRKK